MSIKTVELTQKPDSPFGDPEVGQERRFTLTEKGDFTKAKNEKADSDFGKPFKILEVERKPDWNSEQHGTFHQWKLSIATQEDAAGVVGEAQSSKAVSAPAAASDPRGDKIDRAVAFKAAVSFLCRRDLDNAANPAEIASLTDSLLDVLTGTGPTGLGPTKNAPAESAMDTAESVQSDATLTTNAGSGAAMDSGIPFA